VNKVDRKLRRQQAGRKWMHLRKPARGRKAEWLAMKMVKTSLEWVENLRCTTF